MEKRKSGSIVKKNGKIYARVRFTDDIGKKRDIWRSASSQKDAREKIKVLLNEVKTKTSKELDASRMTFNQLADWYEENYLHEAIYVNDKKISGIRDIKPSQFQLKILRKHFGNAFVQSITHADLLRFKLNRLATPTKQGSQRAVSGVNRELQLCRRLFSLAVKQGWLTKSAFHCGDSLISLANENQRTRILSFPEEHRLFEAINRNPMRFHLKGIVLIAIDTAFRKNEILTLCRKNLDFDNRIITIFAHNCKTSKSRSVGMTERVYKWLLQYENFNTDDRLFPIKSIETSWGRTKKEAALKDFHFHDLRATCISRLISAGIPHAEVMRISGHSTLACLYRYIRADNSTIVRAVNALDAYLLSNSFNGSA